MSLLDALLARVGLVRIRKVESSQAPFDARLAGSVEPPALPVARRVPLGTLAPPSAIARGSQTSEDIGSDDDEWEWKLALARAKASAKNPPPVPPRSVKARPRRIEPAQAKPSALPRARAARSLPAKSAPLPRAKATVDPRVKAARRLRQRRMIRPATTPTVQLLVNKKKPTSTKGARDGWTAADTIVDLVTPKKKSPSRR